MKILFNRFSEAFLGLSGGISAWANPSRRSVDIFEHQSSASTRDSFVEGAAYISHGDSCTTLIRNVDSMSRRLAYVLG